MSHLTPLESAVMDALVWQMGDRVPDLAAQVAASSPGLRRNTGAGLYSQMVVDANRPAANPDATGLFGTVHAMVGDLRDPVGFQVELRQGRLTVLHGQSYGQDTRAIDFSTTAFEEVFIVDERGQSILYRPARQPVEPVAPRSKPAARPAAAVPAQSVPKAQTKPSPRTESKPSDHALPSAAASPDLAEMIAGLSNPTASRGGQLALVYLGAYALAAVFILFAHLVLHVGWIFGLVLAGWALRYLHGKKGRAQMAALAETLDRNGAFQALKPN
ncbi:hypothetical protein [Brevundimonas sp. SORGH_AS_0993]|uniref:hypothetical protein n=1 Tax=Brevundimonas sp. SORGH_AS_0993 TaxID=3041794 RepID=UPI00278AE988|nr:hypothetical protein [Brevundimonas sp. SORGH_AS_0993]MDQ1155396.1 hypothetical protein [Brevundimonas sp. SORGH_AS_0993]